MALIKKVKGITPHLGKKCFIADNATIIGDVKTGDECSFWFNTVVRGDVNSIRMGNKVNVQDGAVIHCTYHGADTQIGNNVSIGHNAIVHGSIIHDDVLVGMGAILMDNCIVNKNVIIAAGAIVTQGMELDSGYVYAGVPAKKIKELSRKLQKGEIQRIANNYIEYASWYK